jgi:hypothetical protein
MTIKTAAESISTDDVVVDFDAIDAEVARGNATGPKTPAADAITVETGPPPTEPAPKTIVKPEEGIDALKKQLDTERVRRLAAENHASELAKAEADARGRAQTSDLDTIKSAIAAVTQSSDILEAKCAESAAAGDWGAAAKAQREMAANAARLQQLESGKTALEKAPKPQPRGPVDPVEAYVARIAPEFPRSREWVRAHADLAKDEGGQEMLLAAHQIAVRRGLVPESPEYFKSIEKTLDLTPAGTVAAPIADEHADDPMADAAATPVAPARRAPAAAPVSRGGPGASSRIVRLTADQVEMAHASFPNSKNPEEEYARQLVALRKEGRVQ